MRTLKTEERGYGRVFAMAIIELEEGAIQIDATIVAEGLGIDPSFVLEQMRAGKITSLSEHGIDEDKGRYRLTFFFENRRFRVVINKEGNVIQRSTVDFGNFELPLTLRKPDV